MELVAPPSRSAAYSIRSGNGATASDPTTYVPGELVTIHIRVEEQRVQQRKKAGELQCYCAPVFKDEIRTCVASYDQGETRVVDGITYGPLYPCTTPYMESAKYIGLLLYAVDASEAKVGTWELAETPPVRFWTPPEAGCGGKAVMHADAQPKHYEERFAFRAPAAGAGTLTFRALLKQGDTQGGAFFWPSSGTLSGDLTLSEGSASGGYDGWFEATAAGQSCNDVCAAAPGPSMVCDQSALNAIDGVTAASLEANAATLDARFASNRPMVSACSAAHPAISDTDERWLFFHRRSASDNTCEASEIVAPSCAAVPLEDGLKLRRICPCMSSVRRRRLRAESDSFKRDAPAATLSVGDTAGSTPCPREVGGDGGNAPSGGSISAAASGCPHYTPPTATLEAARGDAREFRRYAAAPNAAAPAAAQVALSATLALGAALGVLSGAGARSAALAVAPLAALLAVAHYLPSADAHNWIWNPHSRASQASTVKPCRGKKGNVASIHVNPGQEFAIEWSSGHGPYGPQ
jgi:hypothetical protein